MKVLFTLALISSPFSVYAQAGPQGSSTNFMVGMVLMFGVLFFLIILPQSRKQKKHIAFLESLEKGDDVVTQSGLHGKIYGVADKVVTLEIAPQVRVRLEKQSIVAKVGEAA